MEQFGRMLCALRPGLGPANSSSRIKELLRQGVTPVWLPVPMACDDPSIAESWDVTSDSLAAWLCGRLDVRDLLLIKSRTPPPACSSPEEMARQGIVDAAFPSYVQGVGVSVHLLAASDSQRLDARLHQQTNIAGF
jgi:hypothetical protein